MSGAAGTGEGEGNGAEAEVEVLLFLVGPDQLGADASQVLRIERPHQPGPRRSALGSASPKRSLVFTCDEGGAEGALDVDLVLGVRTVPTRDLRRVPPAARTAPHAIGFWLDGDRPVLLIDLPRTLAAPAPDIPDSQRKAT
ncbi:MAG TPA: Frizzy aggregation protein FrzB [Myxococcaceae bacterium]|nr:Frizzy aggregation protein FrzB [Myxococcaceae bacterium]